MLNTTKVVTPQKPAPHHPVAPAVPTQPGSRPRHRGFTLLELLVVVAVIGILAGLLLPALARSRQRAQGIACVGQVRQLALALQLYATDHAETLPHNFGSAETLQTIAAGRYANWVNNVLNWELDPENTNTFLLRAGGLGPYLQGAAGVFRCPADTVVSQLQRRAGWHARTRSYSLNAMLGHPGEFLNGGQGNTNNPGYVQFFKAAQVPEPARIFTFLEEHPDSLNDGYFLNRIYYPEWVDLPASYHAGTANLAFMDGHVETRRWLEASTLRPARPDAAELPYDLAPNERRDFHWLAWHMSVQQPRAGY